jgi:hypothetical protein
LSTNSYGVYGSSTNSYGVRGLSTNHYGVYGESTNSLGLYGLSTNHYGVYGVSTNSYSGYFMRNTATPSGVVPAFYILQDHASDPNAAARIRCDGTGAILELYDGTSEVFKVADGGIVVHSATPDIVSAAGAISVTTPITHVVTNGVGTVVTLANGVEGQVKYIVLKTLTSGGQTDVITPSGGGAGFTTITMDAVGDAVTLLYTNAKWTIVGSFACTIA